MATGRRKHIKVTVGQAVHPGSFDQWLNPHNRLRLIEPERQLDYFFKAVETARNDGADFLLFPELFFPRQFIAKHLKAVCEENHFVIISGLEYGPKYAKPADRLTPLRNEAIVAIPPSLNRNGNDKSPKRKECRLVSIPKILAAEEEEQHLHRHGFTFRKGNKVYVFENTSLGNWAVLICSDFMILPVHLLLQSRIHTLFVLAYNKDMSGFASIADTVQRLLMCNVVICNMGNYGSSLAYSPYRDRHKRNKLHVVGNDVEVAVTVKLPLDEIVRVQSGEILKDDKGNQSFIKLPPDYGKVLKVKVVSKTWN